MCPRRVYLIKQISFGDRYLSHQNFIFFLQLPRTTYDPQVDVMLGNGLWVFIVGTQNPTFSCVEIITCGDWGRYSRVTS